MRQSLDSLFFYSQSKGLAANDRAFQFSKSKATAEGAEPAEADAETDFYPGFTPHFLGVGLGVLGVSAVALIVVTEN